MLWRAKLDARGLELGQGREGFGTVYVFEYSLPSAPQARQTRVQIRGGSGAVKCGHCGRLFQRF